MPKGVPYSSSPKTHVYELTKGQRRNHYLGHLEQVETEVDRKTGDGRVKNRLANGPLSGELVCKHRNNSIHLPPGHHTAFYDHVTLRLWLPRHLRDIFERTEQLGQYQDDLVEIRRLLACWLQLDDFERENLADLVVALANKTASAHNPLVHEAWSQLDLSRTLKDSLDRYNPQAILARLTVPSGRFDDRTLELINQVLPVNRARDVELRDRLRPVELSLPRRLQQLVDNVDRGFNLEDAADLVAGLRQICRLKPFNFPVSVLIDSMHGQWTPLTPEQVTQTLANFMFEFGYADRQFPFNWLAANATELPADELFDFVDQVKATARDLEGLAFSLSEPYVTLCYHMALYAGAIVTAFEAGDAEPIRASAVQYLDSQRYRAMPDDQHFRAWYCGFE